MQKVGSVVILPAVPQEHAWIAQLLSSSEPWLTLGTTYESTMAVCQNAQYQIFIAHASSSSGVDQLAGVIILHPKGLASSPYIKSITVVEQFRGQAIGYKLVEFAESLFRSDSKHIFLCVSSFNKSAQEFYEHLGYRRVGEFNDFVIKGASEFLLHKRLQ